MGEAVVNKQATMRRKGHLTTCLACRMGREIKSLLAADRKQRAANAASTVESHMSNGAVKEAWRALKGWYRSAEDRPPPACPETMVRQTDERVELYARAPPMGGALPFSFPHFAISDDVPHRLRGTHGSWEFKEWASRRGYRDEGRAHQGVA